MEILFKLSWLLLFHWEELVVFVMPAQNKHSSSCAKCRTVNSLAYKLTKAQQIPNKSIHHLINSTTCKLINSTTYQLINLPTCRLKNSSPRQLKKTLTRQLLNSLTHQLINSKTHYLTNLNSYYFFYNWPQILAPFQRKSRLKSWEISTISNLSRLPVCLFLSKEPAFCTILPF